jgi:D-alanyl-lipoteichoic acid acyltransferase DltB (MBOAT superfamily)
MGSASLQFLTFAFVVVILHNLSGSAAWRQAVLLGASLWFLASFSASPQAYVPLIAFLTIGYIGVRAMQSTRGARAYAPLLLSVIAVFFWLKHYAFIPRSLFLHFPYLTVGFSYILFRVLHLIVDARGQNLPGKVTVISYLNYCLNFTTLLSGPIQRYQDFSEMRLTPDRLPLTASAIGMALERIIIGFFKVNVLALALSAVQGEAIRALSGGQPFETKVLAGIIVAAFYPFFLYCNFSGYIDIVIGIARFIGLALPENFNRPFSSDNFLNFWSRWHITLSNWLKAYVYNPLLLAMMRKLPSRRYEPFLGVTAFFVTFFLVGIWHGSTPEFLFFGVLQGLGVSVNKLYQVVMGRSLGGKRYKAIANHPVYVAFSRGLTFTWFTLTLLWFWSNWTQIQHIGQMLGGKATFAVWILILFGSTGVLALWEIVREWCLSLEWNGGPLILSRYVRTAWSTALGVVSLAVAVVLNAPAPEIVYKAF